MGNSGDIETARRRLFIAISLDRRFLGAFSKYRDAMGRKTPFVRWVRPENLHITVLFIGDVFKRDIAGLERVLQEVCARTELFSLMFDKVIYAPPYRQARMIWALFRESNEYKNLVKSVGKDVQEAGIKINDSFSKEKIPHATLARFKNIIPSRRLVNLKRVGIEGEALSVEKIMLMESKLRRGGAEYRTILECSLD